MKRAGLLAVAALAPALLVDAPAHAVDNPIDTARTAARAASYTGTVVERWVDGSGTHEQTVKVSADHGVLRLDGASSVSTDVRGTYVLEGEDWNLVWPGNTGFTLPAPDIGAKYTVSAAGTGPTIAGRPTMQRTVSAGGVRRAEIDTDSAAGLPLRIARYDTKGDLVRETVFTTVTIAPSGGQPAVTLKQVTEAGTETPDAMDVDGLRAPYLAPAELAGSFRKIGVYRRTAAVQVLYSDGLSKVSLFQQAGSLDALPAGEAVTVDGVAGSMTRTAEGTTVVWARRGVVFTAVSDGAPDEVLAAADALGAPKAPSLWQRLRRASRDLLD